MPNNFFSGIPFSCHTSPLRWPASLTPPLAWLKGGRSDIHKKNGPFHDHRVLVGQLDYADPFWEVIEIHTSEGVESFAVDPVAVSKISGLKQGAYVRAEMDEANVLIDVHQYHD